MKKITIINMEGEMEEFDLINSFGIVDIDRDFIIYSKGEKIKEGISKIYVSEVVEESPGVLKLTGISDDTIWDKVKDAMKTIVSAAEGGENEQQ